MKYSESDVSQNPYQSPIIPPSNQERDGPDGAIRLLSEMRDMMQEQLTLSRQFAAINRFAMFFVLGIGGLGIVAVVAAAVFKILTN